MATFARIKKQIVKEERELRELDKLIAAMRRIFEGR